ncbi:hypothetical protein K470DRAFT_263992 [Piedraia hortae CBS 480.64]|uniref:Uncharacterized protein n=1 Tax=Piedraia hortae CBS 480.64 TaxID=1314780 RepID=A0A6A7C0F0_9PEZI|nr:hypothetical protein K470DRAFT_263992 [Piedraia hortae CBS 480.64]
MTIERQRDASAAWAALPTDDSPITTARNLSINLDEAGWSGMGFLPHRGVFPCDEITSSCGLGKCGLASCGSVEDVALALSIAGRWIVVSESLCAIASPKDESCQNDYNDLDSDEEEAQYFIILAKYSGDAFGETDTRINGESEVGLRIYAVSGLKRQLEVQSTEYTEKSQPIAPTEPAPRLKEKEVGTEITDTSTAGLERMPQDEGEPVKASSIFRPAKQKLRSSSADSVPLALIGQSLLGNHHRTPSFKHTKIKICS